MHRTIDIDGLSGDEWLALPDADFDALVFAGDVLFKAGSAEILGAFRQGGGRLTVILAHIDGGGEGVLLRLWVLARALAKKRGWSSIEWIIHAVSCPEPNRKLQRMLALKGFSIKHIDGHGDVYHLVDFR